MPVAVPAAGPSSSVMQAIVPLKQGVRNGSQRLLKRGTRHSVNSADYVADCAALAYLGGGFKAASRHTRCRAAATRGRVIRAMAGQPHVCVRSP